MSGLPQESRPPKLFKLTIVTEYLGINRSEKVATMFLGNRSVVLVVNEATHFTAAAFIPNQSAK